MEATSIMRGEAAFLHIITEKIQIYLQLFRFIMRKEVMTQREEEEKEGQRAAEERRKDTK